MALTSQYRHQRSILKMLAKNARTPMTNTRRIFLANGLIAATVIPIPLMACASTIAASTAEDLNKDADQAVQMLYRTNLVAADIGRQASAMLVFPKIIKAGFGFGGSYGKGVLKQGPRVIDYYNSYSVSWGLQIGGQSFGYIVFLMNQEAVDFVNESDGWEIGVGPTVALVEAGAAKNLSTSTLKDDAYAFIFGQEGLMAGVSIEGTKISKITP